MFLHAVVVSVVQKPEYAPGSQAPGGSGVDIKHNSYDRYLLRKKGRAMKAGPYVGDDVDSKAIVNNKVQATNSLGLDCDCPPIIVGRSGAVIAAPDDFFSGRAVIWKSPPSQLKDSNGGYDYAIPNAYGVSPNGEIVGLLTSLKPSFFSYNPVYWSSSSADALNLSLTDSSNETYPNGVAYSINSNGNIVGAVFTSVGTSFIYNPAYWASPTSNVTILNLTDDEGNIFTNGIANSINSKGEIVGCVYNEVASGYQFITKAAYWENPSTPFQKLFNKFEDLLPDNPRIFSNALSINTNSEIVGYNSAAYSQTIEWILAASYWSPETKKTDSEFLKNGTIANSINSNGDIVGNASKTTSTSRPAFPQFQFPIGDSYPAYWSRDSKFTKVEILSEINTAGAVSINTKGEIIGIEKVAKFALGKDLQLYILNDLFFSLASLSTSPNKGLYWKYYYSKQQQLENLTGPDDCTMPFDIQ